MNPSAAASWAVVQIEHFPPPDRHIPKLVVVGVPESATEGDLKDALAKGGYRFSVYGASWYDHYLVPTAQITRPETLEALQSAEMTTTPWTSLLGEG